MADDDTPLAPKLRLIAQQSLAALERARREDISTAVRALWAQFVKTVNPLAQQGALKVAVGLEPDVPEEVVTAFCERLTLEEFAWEPPRPPRVAAASGKKGPLDLWVSWGDLKPGVHPPGTIAPMSPIEMLRQGRPVGTAAPCFCRRVPCECQPKRKTL